MTEERLKRAARAWLLIGAIRKEGQIGDAAQELLELFAKEIFALDRSEAVTAPAPALPGLADETARIFEEARKLR